MIFFNKVSKEFQTKAGNIQGLDQVDLHIPQGDIFGIIGMSGAGKSTFIRCVNYLERPTSGKVVIDGHNMADLSEKNLREIRKEIGMIFQHFNLLMQKNVLDNVCFSMKIAGVGDKEAKKRARELLKIVGLDDKEKAYPSQLSGGQKQRVAIARAIANNPKILLCDEATSALDPQTTKSVLELLKKINREYGITIVIVTHEMSVVQEICDKVAILDNGNLVETGSVSEIFTAPKSHQAKRLILGSGNSIEQMRGRHCIRIVFKENSSYEPVIGNMTLQFKTPVNILYANTKDLNGTATGEMILQLPEEAETAQKMVEYLKEKNLYVGEVEQDVFLGSD
ncbi:MAG: ATP-binding cassette domain-containing protein [Lachnospiraceae bacterium]|nr:ATP-binding cassette domain-containing protein [Lachnospiraceae bacterium]